jgi:hypothetical protein
MKRMAVVVASMAAVVLGASGNAIAQTNGGGNSANAPGQERAASQCENVWSNLQAELRAGGGPKSGPSVGPIGTFPDGSGPTNCDHFWQGQGAIGNG